MWEAGKAVLAYAATAGLAAAASRYHLSGDQVAAIAADLAALAAAGTGIYTHYLAGKGSGK